MGSIIENAKELVDDIYKAMTKVGNLRNTCRGSIYTGSCSG